MLKNNDCVIEKIGDKLVRITSKSSKFKVNVREERIASYVEGYKEGLKPEDNKDSEKELELGELREEAKKLGINGMHNAKKETILKKIEEAKAKMEDDDLEE